MKKILNNLSFNYKKDKKVLNCSIIIDLAQELKREMKMIMAIKDPNQVNLYVDIDFKLAQELLDQGQVE
jgi:hypothetical protein